MTEAAGTFFMKKGGCLDILGFSTLGFRVRAWFAGRLRFGDRGPREQLLGLKSDDSKTRTQQEGEDRLHRKFQSMRSAVVPLLDKHNSPPAGPLTAGREIRLGTHLVPLWAAFSFWFMFAWISWVSPQENP